MRVKHLLWASKFDSCDMNISKAIVAHPFCDDIDNKSWNRVYKTSVAICIFKKKKILYRIQYILSNHVHTPYIQGLLEKLTDKVIYRKILCVLYDDVCFIKHMILKKYIEFYFAWVRLTEQHFIFLRCQVTSNNWKANPHSFSK